jgi:hypothetical protein
MFDPFESGTRNGGVGRAYISPSKVAMGGIDSEATPMSSYIPGGHFGGKSVGKGTVIPRHKPGRGGGSLGYNPHKPPHRNVIVDPHVPGRAVALDLAKIRPEDSEQAFQTGVEFADQIMEDPPEKMDGIEMTIEEGPRLAGYAAVRMLADNYGAVPDDQFSQLGHSHGAQTLQVASGGQTFGAVGAGNRAGRTGPHTFTVPPATTGQAKAAAFGAPTVGRPVAPVQVVNGNQPPGIVASSSNQSPMARFRPAPVQQPPPQPQAQPPRVVDQSHQTVGPPTQKVVFDFGEQVGQFPVQYHQVIRTDGGLVLVWDTRWPYGEPYSPEHLTQQFAIQVAGDPEVHLVMSTGRSLTFEHNGFRYYLLGIVESMAADGGS